MADPPCYPDPVQRAQCRARVILRIDIRLACSTCGEYLNNRRAGFERGQILRASTTVDPVVHDASSRVPHVSVRAAVTR
jgi:hypothetical protein